jgi:hypothetical protein
MASSPISDGQYTDVYLWHSTVSRPEGPNIENTSKPVFNRDDRAISPVLKARAYYRSAENGRERP